MSSREMSLYLAAVFGTVAFSHAAARFGWEWPAAIRFLSAIVGA